MSSDRSQPGISEISFGPVEFFQPINEKILESNPGIGGTQFALFLLAHAVAEHLPDIQVSLDYLGGPVAKIGRLRPRRVKAFGSFRATGGMIVLPLSSVKKLEPEQVANSHLVVICQHPRDRSLPEVIEKFGPLAVIHVGKFSFWSNFRTDVINLHVPNLMPTQLDLSRAPAVDSGQKNSVGFLGALTPGKRFHEVASAWSKVAEASPGISLEVLGSSSTHGQEEGHPELPTSESYGRQVLASFGVKSLTELENVSFFGNVGSEKNTYIRNWGVGIVNPDGGTESFCYAWRELIFAGVPTLAGKREGMRELLSGFSGLALMHSSEIPGRVHSILSGDFDHSAFSRQRSRFISRAQRLEADRLQKFLRFVSVSLQSKRQMRRYLISLSTWPAATPAVISELFRHSKTGRSFARGRDKIFSLLKKATRTR